MQDGGKQAILDLRCLPTASFQAADTGRDLALLDADERNMAERLRRAEDRRDYVAAHALLRRMLSIAAPETAPQAWRFDRTSRGKPYVRGAGAALPFSLSHTRGLVACVVGRAGELGLDIERDAALDPDGLIPGTCSAAEAEHLAALHPSQRTSAFLDLWTLKEAYAKARGTGIADGLATTEFHLEAAGVISGRLGPEAEGSCHFTLFRPTADSRMALAIEGCDVGAAMPDASLVEPDGTLTTLRAVRTGTLDHEAR